MQQTLGLTHKILKKIVLKVLVWSRGVLATFQIPAGYLSIGEGHSTSGLCLLFLN